jgi:hypothetical protein
MLLEAITGGGTTIRIRIIEVVVVRIIAGITITNLIGIYIIDRVIDTTNIDYSIINKDRPIEVR